MRISKESDQYLFDEYSTFIGYNKSYESRCQLINSYVDIFRRQLKIIEFNICANFLDNLYHSFSVNYISEQFYEAAKANYQKLIERIDNIGFYKALGQCAGYLVYGGYCYTYSITENCVYCSVNARKGDDTDRTFFSTSQTGFSDYLNSVENRDDLFIALLHGLALLVLLKNGRVETVLAASNTKRKIPEVENGVLMNSTPFPIRYIDSSWLKTIIRTEGFLVRGHFRLQPHGIGRSERKLIYIQPFKKHGYVRRAKKLVYEEQNGIDGETSLSTEAR